MKKLFVFCFSILICLAQAQANDYNEALDMIHRGDFAAALAELKPLVELGLPIALYQQGNMYANGYGVRKDLNKAFELYHRAADRGIPEAQFTLAQMYLNAKGVKKDTSKAFQYTRRAAEKGLAAAQFNLALMYQNGDYTPQSYSKAANWYRDSAMQNYALAQFNLALLYFEGLGVNKDIEMSYIWNRVAAFNGYGPAEKSMTLDAKQLSREQIKRGRERADELYLKIAPNTDEFVPMEWSHNP